MTDKRKALEDILKAGSEYEGNITAVGSAVIEHWDTVYQALAEPDDACEAVGKEYCWVHDQNGEECAKKSIKKDTKTDEKNIIKDTELEEAINQIEEFCDGKLWSASEGKCSFSNWIEGKHLKTLIRAAKPRKKFTKEELVEIAWDAGVDEVDVDALISAGVINVKEG